MLELACHGAYEAVLRELSDQLESDFQCARSLRVRKSN